MFISGICPIPTDLAYLSCLPKDHASDGDSSMTTENIVPGDVEDGDSAYGDDLSTWTQSLRSSVLAGVKEHGRQYHSYQSGTNYFMPEDQDEQERLELQHHAFLLTLNNELQAAPIDRKHIKEVLDLGTGPGHWAIDFADANPDANVTGTDLSAVQPTLTPPNCRFIVDDFTKAWLHPQKFSFIHGRMLNLSFDDPPGFFKKVYDALEPGGWFEMLDTTLPIESDDNTIPEDSAIQQWCAAMAKAMKTVGKDWGWSKHYGEYMERVGFTNVSISSSLCLFVGFCDGRALTRFYSNRSNKRQ
jgi:SAM-dependent methyltransferase